MSFYFNNYSGVVLGMNMYSPMQLVNYTMEINVC
jgi:hypothetical protein